MPKNTPIPKASEAPAGWQSQLGRLADPKHYTGSAGIDGFSPSALLDGLHKMIVIRLAEEAIADMAIAGHAKCPVHLAIGQEGVAVGVAAHLRKTDRAFGCHRSHSHYLAMGGDVRKLFAEVLGKATGCSHGFGGSMHLYAKESGFYGSVPIVAGTIPLAVGAAIAAKFDGKGDIALAFFGDGACEEGIFHECLNMAAIMNLPVIFVVENNLFSSHLDINLRQPSDRIARFAEAACIPHITVDGNDLPAVTKEAGKLIASARANCTPALIEGVTYRWRGHVGPSEDIDVGLRRSPDDIAAWKARDPVARLQQSLVAGGHTTDAAVKAYTDKTRAEFAQMCKDALSDPWPPEASLMENVYAG